MHEQGQLMRVQPTPSPCHDRGASCCPCGGSRIDGCHDQCADCVYETVVEEVDTDMGESRDSTILFSKAKAREAGGFADGGLGNKIAGTTERLMSRVLTTMQTILQAAIGITNTNKNYLGHARLYIASQILQMN